MQEVTATITAGGTAQAALEEYNVQLSGAPAEDGQGESDPDAYLVFQNQSTGVLTFTMNNTAASASNGFQVAAGVTYERQGTCVEGGPISVYGATTGQQFYVARGSRYGL